MIGIVDYRAGNLTSVARALEYLGEACIVTGETAVLDRTDRIVFPGVGAAGTAMAHLREIGLDQALMAWVKEGRPVLGICLGTQVIFDYSEEDDCSCLGLVSGRVRRFPAGAREDDMSLKVPHMGWNSVAFTREHPVFSGLPEAAEFYFVHSYYPIPQEEHWVAGWTTYGVRFCAALARGNLVAVQFHPEKSGRLGLQILANFCRWEGTDA